MGSYEKPTEIDVKIPAGIDSENQLRLSGMGNEGVDGSGDLFVNINVQRHPRFNRVGKDIHAQADVTVSQAVLGCVKEVGTIYGVKKVKIPAGFQSGKILNLPGFGMADLSGDESLKGSFKLKLNVKIPTGLNEEQKLLFEKLRSLE